MIPEQPFEPVTFEEVKRAQNSFKMEDEYGGEVIVDFDQLEAALNLFVSMRRQAFSPEGKAALAEMRRQRG